MTSDIESILNERFPDVFIYEGRRANIDYQVGNPDSLIQAHFTEGKDFFGSVFMVMGQDDPEPIPRASIEWRACFNKDNDPLFGNLVMNFVGGVVNNVDTFGLKRIYLNISDGLSNGSFLGISNLHQRQLKPSFPYEAKARELGFVKISDPDSVAVSAQGSEFIMPIGGSIKMAYDV